MDRPDPATDLVGSIRYLMDHVDQIVGAQERKRLSPTQTEHVLGYSRGYLSPTLRPWRVPGFGIRGARHTLAEWRAHLERPERTLRAEWDALPRAEQKRALGIAS